MNFSLSRRQFLQIAAASACASTCSTRFVSADETTDKWHYLDNGIFRLGVNLSGGASIGHFAYSAQKTGADTRNVLNHYDRGRFIQQSYYGDEDGSDWNGQPWRYNPVQGGEWKGTSARVDKWKMDGETFFSRTTPRNWAGGQLLEECTMSQWLTLQKTHAHLKFRFEYRGEKTHQARHQEIPAMFVRADLDHLSYYEGDKPWTNQAVKNRVPGWPNESAKLSEHWAAYVGADGKGVGLYVPISDEATCYRFQGAGEAGCSYVAPLTTFALKPNFVWEYEAFLTLGTIEEMRAIFQSLSQNLQHES